MPDLHLQRRRCVALVLAPLLTSSVLMAPAAPAPARDARSDAPAARAGAPRTPAGVALSWTARPTCGHPRLHRGRGRRDGARQFDLVAAMPVAFQDHVAAMRRANPDLTLLSYANATLAPPAR